MKDADREITACYLVSAALKRCGIDISEDELEAIWNGPEGEFWRLLLEEDEKRKR